jgi:hypothetical protein
MTSFHQGFAKPPDNSFGAAVFVYWDRSIVNDQNMHAQY